MLPYVSNRLQSLVRCPDGIQGECFYQKHYQDSMVGLESQRIEQSDGEEADYIYLTDIDGLRQAVQLNTIEFHGWGSRIDQLERPDQIVFDLDPDEDLGLKEVRRGVRDLKAILDELGLVAFLKTSGGKGYHVVVPLTPQAGWDEIRDFSKQVASVMEQKWPDRYTANMRKEKRKGKIYVDWVRNGRGATSVAPYSVRARSGAPVSWPISWSDLNKIAPNDMTIKKALRSRKKDPWTGFFNVKQKLK
jgi:bifunctional non-homologous end joining protein LigD